MELKLACAPNLSTIIDELISAYNVDKVNFSVTIGENCNVYLNEILSGKRYDVFLSADMDGAKKLVDKGLVSKFRIYAKGKLCLWSLKESLKVENLPVFRIAMPDPAIAPYGKAAKEFLERTKLFELVIPNALLGKSPFEVSHFVIENKADVAFLPVSFVKSTLKCGNFKVLEPDFYQTINQSGVILKNAPRQANDFFDWLFTQKAREIFEKYGL